MKKEDVLEVREVSENEILDDIIIHKKFNSEWLKECFVRGIPDFDFVKHTNKDKFWLCLMQGTVVGYCYLKQKENLTAEISFWIKDDFTLSKKALQTFVEKTVLNSFNTDQWEKILYNCGDKCSAPIARTFLEHFKPHPVGWVHLNDGRFVLTRGQIDRTEKEFYKI